MTPRFGGRVLKDWGDWAASFEMAVRGDCIGCDCNRTRTTSRGVTIDVSIEQKILARSYQGAKSIDFQTWQTSSSAQQ